jgi:hypothetical protein
MDIATVITSYIAATTYNRGQKRSPYLLFERYHYPLSPNMAQEGCGELNLVSVTEPLKLARLHVGIDDSKLGTLTLIPRLPLSWRSASATNWPIRISKGVIVLVNVTATLETNTVCVEVGSAVIPTLKIRLGRSSHAWNWISRSKFTGSFCFAPS